jgi:hypothetical protein
MAKVKITKNRGQWDWDMEINDQKLQNVVSFKVEYDMTRQNVPHVWFSIAAEEIEIDLEVADVAIDNLGTV